MIITTIVLEIPWVEPYHCIHRGMELVKPSVIGKLQSPTGIHGIHIDVKGGNRCGGRPMRRETVRQVVGENIKMHARVEEFSTSKYNAGMS